MTVTVTLPDDGTDKYMRFGDVYVEHNDGGLDVYRGGAKQTHSYASGEWTDVEGDQKRFKRRGCWGRSSRRSLGATSFLAFGVDWLVSRSCWRCHRRHCRRRAAHKSIALRPTDQPSGRSRTKFEDPLHEIV